MINLWDNSKTQKELQIYKNLMDEANFGVVTKFDHMNLRYKLHNGHNVSILYSWACYGYEEGKLELAAWYGEAPAPFIHYLREDQTDDVIGFLTGKEAFELVKKLAEKPGFDEEAEEQYLKRLEYE